MLPYGVPFESLSFGHLPLQTLFDFKFSYEIDLFFSRAIFYIDGWMGWDGWDGWSVNFFFFLARILKSTWYFFITVSGSLTEAFHIFWNILRNKTGMFFLNKFRQNQKSLFSRIFFKNFSNFSKTTQYLFLIDSGPLRRVMKTFFGK